MDNKISPYIDYDLEEVLLSEGIETDETLKKYLYEIEKTVPHLTPETEKQLLQDIDQPCNKKRLAEGYLRSVVMIAKEYTDSHNKLINLIASGNNDLRKAGDSFDCTENISFSLLAEWIVRQEILKDIQDK